MKNHTCVESDTCTCSIVALEPNDNCPIHGCGEWPPRCKICGKFLRHDVRNAVTIAQHGKVSN